MKKVNNPLNLILPFAVLLIVQSCTGDLGEVKEVKLGISPEFGLPIARAELFIADAFREEANRNLSCYADSKGLLHIRINENLDTLKIRELLFDSLENMGNLYDSIVLPRVPKGISIESPVTYFKMHLDSFEIDQQIDSLILNDGTIEFNFETWENYDSEFSVVVPNLTDAQGLPIRFEDFKPSASNHVVVMSLRDSKLKINTSPTSKGIFSVNLGYLITGKTTSSSKPAPVIYVRMYGLDIHAAYGKLRNLPVDIEPWSRSLPEFDLIEEDEAELDLAKPDINLLFLNQVGFPFKFDITRLGVIHNLEFFELTGIQKSVYIQAPPLGSQNQFTTNLLRIEPWSNIDQLLGKFPEEILLEGKVTINPFDPEAYNFVREEDVVIIRLEADIPLQFSLKRVSIENISEVDFSGLEEMEDKFEKAGLRIKALNRYPLDVTLQAYFTDRSGEVLDSLFSAPVVVKAAKDAATPTESVFRVDKGHDRIVVLKNATNMVSRAAFNTSGNGSTFVDFNSSQSLSLEIAGFARINL
jgi:hypothetical protein